MGARQQSEAERVRAFIEEKMDDVIEEAVFVKQHIRQGDIGDARRCCSRIRKLAEQAHWRVPAILEVRL
jgi:hypothetical protein